MGDDIIVVCSLKQGNDTGWLGIPFSQETFLEIFRWIGCFDENCRFRLYLLCGVFTASWIKQQTSGM